MSDGLSDDDELLAAELAFGLIDGAERAAGEDRLAREPELAAAFDRWQAYAAALATDRGEAPRPSVWSAIEARLPANDTASSGALRRWQVATFAAAAAALVLAVVSLRALQPVPVPAPSVQAPVAPMVAVLTGKQGGFVTVSFDPASGRMTAAANGLDLGDHSPELWVIPADGKPRSMGVMNAAAPGWGKVPADAAKAMAAGVTLAVSVEPVGGSPTGQPTGPVILSGKLIAA